MATITIFTPTYNRAYSLPRLYESLCRQTSKDFIWSIVDDGSSDNTKELVEKWQAINAISIIYTAQINGGKMRAHNKGAALCDTELFLCVDSDDFLVDNAVELVLQTWQTHPKDSFVCGIVAYKTILNGEKCTIPARFPTLQMSSLSDLYAKGFHGDTTLIFKSDVIKKYPFAEIDGEKFVTEAYAYEQIDQRYKYVLLDEALTICEYQEDGYTHNILKLHYKNPKGMALYYNQHSVLTVKGKIDSLRAVVYYIIYSRIAGNKHVYKNSNKKGLFYLVAWILSFHYYKILIKQING